MIRKKIVRQLILVVSLIIMLVSTVNFTFGYIVTKTDSAINTFPPLEIRKNDVILNKSVEHPFGNDYVIPAEIAFDFQVNLGQLYANTTIKTSSGNIISDEKGTISVSLKPNESFTLQNIDVGTKVTVAEKQEDGSGFNVKDGNVIKEATVTEDGSLTIDYVNIYTPAAVTPDNVKIVGVKNIRGRDWQSGDMFSFNLEQRIDGDSWRSLGTKSISYDRANASFNKFDFNDVIQALEFDAVGVYDFRVSEAAGNIPNVSFDTTVYNFSISVTDVNMDGKLEIGRVWSENSSIVKYADGVYTVDVEFNNIYTSVEPDQDTTNVFITVDKIVKNVGKYSVGRAGFEFVLVNDVTGERLVMNSNSDGKAIFSLLFGMGDAGKTYSYTLTETNKGMEGMTYDTSVYRISVSITLDENSKPVAAVTVNGEAVTDAVARFENIYNGELEAPPTGTDSKALIYVIIMAFSAICCTSIICTERKRRNRI